MAALRHTFGQTCKLSRGNVKPNLRAEDDIPYLASQYFYYAPYSVDDPLSAVPVSAASESKSIKHPPLPFSARDNNSLEEAWLKFVSGESNDRKGGVHNTGDQKLGRGAVGDNGRRKKVSSQLKDGETTQRKGENPAAAPTIDVDGETIKTSGVAAVEDEDIERGRKQSTKLPPTKNPPSGSAKVTPVDIKKVTRALKDFGSDVESPVSSIPSSLPQTDAGTTGLPFVKLPSRSTSPRARSSYRPETGNNRRLSIIETSERDTEEHELGGGHSCRARGGLQDSHSEVPVGISKLYLVELPSLLMKPIYWAHVHDTAAVIRATWFYKETMIPVEPAVANQLEIGYRDLRAWSQTWSDELNSAVEVGAAGEERIAHRLWPADEKPDPKKNLLSSNPQCAARCFHGEAAAEGTLEDNLPLTEAQVKKRKFPNCQVIYKDAKDAFILKSNLQPSAYYGRKPLQKIRKGRTVGLHVVRGFDRGVWDSLHPPKKSVQTTQAKAKIPISGDVESANMEVCEACKSHDQTPNVSDLCLVIHGIGQKLSERVESFNFTHACNAVRRSVNVELGSGAVKKVLRKDLGSIMVLPVNWRSNLSFEDGGPKKDDDLDESSPSFTLKEITPSTIPAVRNLISDVMLDIPYYLSHHKDKMIQAVVKEANRVYRLWCQNNPGFHNSGRVHIIAHSLGSTMALEVLSKQPTRVGDIAFTGTDSNDKYFDFNTTNLFCAGSPAGFFLLLERGKLTPRKNQDKPGAEFGDSQDPNIVGEAGTFGCLAVDNIYNIMHINDPIAYRLNATVDPQYASSLREAHVPSATTGFFEGIGNGVRSIVPGLAAPIELAVGEVHKPAMITRLPSQLELEVHDFTREEIAEKKFYLLNDNGQIDWLLSSGGGPFDIAYLDMLGAHSSYWEKKEFIRLLVTEVGREPGKRNTLPNMRAVKVSHKT